MCHYDDASRMMWRNVCFLEDGSGFKKTFELRKNAQFRQGNKTCMFSRFQRACVGVERRLYCARSVEDRL